MYNEGISSTGSLLDLALEMDIIQKRGSWFTYNGTQLAQGRDAAKELIKADPALYADLETKVKEGLEAKKEKITAAAGTPVIAACRRNDRLRRI